MISLLVLILCAQRFSSTERRGEPDGTANYGQDDPNRQDCNDKSKILDFIKKQSPVPLWLQSLCSTSVSENLSFILCCLCFLSFVFCQNVLFYELSVLIYFLVTVSFMCLKGYVISRIRVYEALQKLKSELTSSFQSEFAGPAPDQQVFSKSWFYVTIFFMALGGFMLEYSLLSESKDPFATEGGFFDRRLKDIKKKLLGDNNIFSVILRCLFIVLQIVILFLLVHLGFSMFILSLFFIPSIFLVLVSMFIGKYGMICMLFSNLFITVMLEIVSKTPIEEVTSTPVLEEVCEKSVVNYVNKLRIFYFTLTFLTSFSNCQQSQLLLSLIALKPA